MEHEFRRVAGIIGDPTRATILWTLLDGKALTATELAIAADTTAQNVSMHLSKLTQAEFLSVEAQGRHRYYRYSRKEIAYAVEALASLISNKTFTTKQLKDEISPIEHCRTCYDHLAGKTGVLITESLIRQKIILNYKNKFELSSKGEKWFEKFGVDTTGILSQRRSFLRPCLDWTERRHHMAGSLAAAMLQMMMQQDWIRRTKNSRAVIVTGKGRKNFYELFRING